jgi:hypothetical protein
MHPHNNTANATAAVTVTLLKLEPELKVTNKMAEIIFACLHQSS